MPATPRDRRREERAQTAQRWATWLKQALDDAHVTAAELIAKSDGDLESGKVTHWTKADNTASAEGALTVARLLGRDPAQALRAAGHDALADALAQSIADATARTRSETEAELRERLAGLDAELEARLARYLPPPIREETGGRVNGEHAS